MDNTEQPRSGPGIPDLPADFDYAKYAEEKVDIITVTLVECGKPRVIEYTIAETVNGGKRVIRKDTK